MPPELVTCPGCGGSSPAFAGPTHPYMTASPGCWAAFGTILEREYSNACLMAVHDLSVDAYAVQHPGGSTAGHTRQAIRSVALHLCRLTLRLGHGWSGSAASAAMLRLARHESIFERLEPPTSMGIVTAAEVALAVDPPEHAAAVHGWARSALSAWNDHRASVERWLALIDEAP